MACSSSSNPHSHPRAFSGIEPQGKRRKVEESSRLFDVFINHRGPDVKQTVAIQLYNSLTKLRIHAFLDSEEKELGDSFPSTIENAIHSASAQIAIFSNGYAESPWCLAELVLMLQSRAKIFPVFYGVKPSDLRYIENGVYAEAFTKYEKKERYMEKLKEWKEALQSVSFITGHEISSNSNDWQNIVSAVQKEVQRTKSLHVAKYPVGLHKLVEDFERLCLNELVKDFERQCWTNRGGKEKAQIVGIFGMGGAGKTTLAKELFNRKKFQKRTCFLFDVRTAYATNSFPSLQLKLVKDLFQQDGLNFHCTEEGTSHIGDCIGRSNQLSFLIVLDDIDHVQQLDALLIMELLKNSVNSLVIVTTRDVGVLINAGITAAYNLKGLDRDDARELFCWHAFGQPHPANDYQNLVNSFLNVCGGLPLSLQVLGSHVRGKDQKYWSLELNKVRKTLPRDIHQRLKISFDSLDYEEQQMFMDIACFFVDKLKEIAIQVWEASGWSAQHALETLVNKCIVQEIDWDGSRLRMHDHLRDLGRDMANGLSRPCRLWRPQDLEYLKSEESQNIFAQTKGRCFHSILDKLTGYQITYFVGESEFSAEWATILLWLQVEFPSRIPDKRLHPSIPSWIPLQNLRFLIIRNLCIKTLWQSHVQAPTQLKELKIYNTSLEEFSDLSGMSNSLEKILINRWPRLKTVSGLSDLKKLTELNISTCPELEELPNFARQTCLEKITIVRCGKLQNIILPTTLVDLTIDDCRELKTVAAICNHSERLELQELSSVARMSYPKQITIRTCHKLQTIQGIDELRASKSLQLIDCPELEKLPCIAHQTCLEKITIVGCGKLQNITLLTLPTTLVDLTIHDCRELKTVAAICDHSECLVLQKLSSVDRLSCLKQITIRTCDKLQTRQGIDELHALESLQLINCPELEDLPCFTRLTCLEKISIVRCGKLQNITLPTTLVDLTIHGCRELKIVICDHSKRVELQELSSVARLSCLKQITIRTCDKLQTIQGIDELRALESLQLIDCPELEELPCFARQTCLEQITIVRCGKLQSITLPTTLVDLTIDDCRELKTMAAICDHSECLELQEFSSVARLSCLKKIIIRNCDKLQTIQGIDELRASKSLQLIDCPELEELPCFARQTCLEKITIVRCGKLQNITLPTTLVDLTVHGCRELQTVATICDHSEHLELQELSSVARLSCLKKITIRTCDKLQTIQGIDELQALKSMQLSYCSNTAIQNCITMLKSLPSELLIVMGRPADGALSTLNSHLFSDANAVIHEIGSRQIDEEIMAEWSAVIFCAVVVVDSFTTTQKIHQWLLTDWHSYSSGWLLTGCDRDWGRVWDYDYPSNVCEGECLITIVTTPDRRKSDNFFWEHVLLSSGIIKKGYTVGVKKGEEWKSEHVLYTIIDKLYHK